MKIFHTSDWHLGRTLYGKKRYAEFEAFLNWLIEQIELKSPDLLIIAGDIFYIITPQAIKLKLIHYFWMKALLHKFDKDSLQTALDALDSLQRDGKLIGIISHVGALKDRISLQIQVEPLSGGVSKISGVGCSWE